MLVLALDTSANFVSVALLNEDKVFSFVEQDMERGQAEALIPLIQRILSNARFEMKDVQAVAVTVGPGSFTGVRIGLACARALGLALDIPVYGVTCFEVWSYHLGRSCKVVLDSKRDDFYVQSFNADGNATDAPAVLSAEQLKESLPFAAIGTGADLLGNKIPCEVIYKLSPTAVAAGRIALSRRDNPLAASPLYLRDADVTL